MQGEDSRTRSGVCCCGFTTLWAQWAASLRLWLRPSPVAHVLVAEQVCALFATVTDMFYLCRAMPVVVCISEAFWLPEDSGSAAVGTLNFCLDGNCAEGVQMLRGRVWTGDLTAFPLGE